MGRIRFGILFLPALLSAQSTLNLSRDLVTLGIAATNLTPNTPALDARPLLEAAVAYAQKNAVTTLTADPGSYYFTSLHSLSQHVLLKDVTNLTIDLQYSDLYFATSNTTGIQCLNCSSVTLQDFTVDYKQLPFTQATITAVDSVNRVLTWKALPGWQSPGDFNTNRAPDGSDTIWMFIFRNGVPVTQVGRLAGGRPVAGNTVQITNTQDPWAQPANIGAIQPGDTLVWTDRSGPPAVGIDGGQKVAVRNVSIYAAGQIGLLFSRTAAATADRVQVIPRPGTSRLISTNADGIHASFTLANTNLTNNIVRRACDDSLALQVQWLATVQTVAGATVQVKRNFTAPFPSGVPVTFISTVDASVVGSANIVAESPSDQAQTLADGELVTLTLDHAVTGLAAGFGMIDNDALKRGSGSVIANNTVYEDVFARGIWLAGVQGVQVHDNLVQKTSSVGILIQELNGSQFMSGPTTSVTIKNNLVDSALNYGGISTGPVVAAASIRSVAESSASGQVTTRPHSSVFVQNNRVTNSPRSAIRMENVAGGDITGNTIQGYALNPATNVYAIPPCCESMGQFLNDFQQPVLSTNSLVDVSGNTSVADTGSLLSNVSSASGFPRLAVNSWVVAYGTKLPPLSVVTTLPFPTSINGASVQVMDSGGVTRAAPMYYTSPTQVAYLIPDGTALGLATVTIGGNSGAAQIDTVAPSIYTANASGSGVAAALAAVYTAAGGVTPQTVFQCPAGVGSCVAAPMSLGGAGDRLIVSLYGTGWRNVSALKNVVASIGGVPATVQYLGAVAGNPGLDQANLIVPASLAGAGEVPVVLMVDGQTANSVSISLK